MATTAVRTTAAGRPPVALVVSGGLLGVLVAVVLLGATGALAAGPFDPGAVVRYGLPVARVVHDLAAATTVGLLVLAAWCIAPSPGTKPRRLEGPRQYAVRLSVGSAAVWLAAGLVVLVLTAADVSGFRPGQAGFSGVLFSFVTQIDLGRVLAVSLVGVFVVANLAFTAGRVATVAWAAVLSVLALLPLALAGHAAGSQDHMNAVDSLALHLVGVCVWVGGLVGLLLLASRLGPQLPTVARRYSVLALWCFVVVAGSGVVNAALRLGSVAGLASAYGLLVVGKVVALGLLGAAGLVHRRVTLGRLAERPRLFLRIAAVEVVVMAATLGLAVALARSAPPAGDAVVDPVGALLGFPAPAPYTLGRYLSAFYPDLLWLSVAAAMCGLYAAGLLVLRRRGDRWPLQRTIFWAAGALALVFVTSGGPAVYGRLHFSTHMVQHMALMVLVPLLLVFGAPVTLAMRTLPARTDGSFGAREMLLAMVHSTPLKIVGHPVVAALLFTGSLTVFYYSRLFDLAMFTHTGHVLMTAHFLLSGYVFIWALVGIDPGPARPSYPFRMVLLLLTLAFHAFFGISLMASNSLLAPDWWHALGYTDDAALVADQQTGGGIAWGAGDIPSLLLAVALLIGWVRSDAAETKRLDRKADRDGDAELKRYNEQLAALARRDQT